MNILEKLGIGNDTGEIANKVSELIGNENFGTVKSLADNLGSTLCTFA